MAGDIAELSKNTLIELIELNQRIATEEQQGEAARDFFQGVLSDQLTFRRASGKVVGKAGPDGFLEGLTNNPFSERGVEGKVAVTPVDDRALVTLIVVGRRKDDGSVHRYRNIRLFSRAAQNWIMELWYNYEIT